MSPKHHKVNTLTSGEAIQAVSTCWSKRGPDTDLTQTFLDMTKAESPSQLLEGLVSERYARTAEASNLVFQVAAKGDKVAVQIINWVGVELASFVNVVIRQLSFEELSFKVIMVSRLIDGGQLLIESYRSTIHALAPNAQLVHLDTPPVTGAVLLGMEQAGMNTNTIRQNLIDSMKSVI